MPEIEIDQELFDQIKSLSGKSESVGDVISRLVNSSGRGETTIPKLYSASEAMRMLDMSRSTLFRKIREYSESGGRSGLGPVSRIGERCLRIPEPTLARYLKTHTGY